MGNQQSIATTITDVTNNAVNNVLINNTQSCNQANALSASQNFEGIKANNCVLNFSGIHQNITNASNLSCMQEANVEIMLKNDLQNELNQQAQAAIKGTTLNLNSQSISDAVAKIYNGITNDTDIRNTSNCISSNLLSASQDVKNINLSCPYCEDCLNANNYDSSKCDKLCNVNFSNFTQNLVNNASSSCIAKQDSIQNVINELATSLTQTNTAQTGMNMELVLFLILGIMILGLVIYIIFSNNVEKEIVKGAGKKIKKIFKNIY
jgi:hypothetical protein